VTEEEDVGQTTHVLEHLFEKSDLGRGHRGRSLVLRTFAPMDTFSGEGARRHKKFKNNGRESCSIVQGEMRPRDEKKSTKDGAPIQSHRGIRRLPKGSTSEREARVNCRGGFSERSPEKLFAKGRQDEKLKKGWEKECDVGVGHHGKTAHEVG